MDSRPVKVEGMIENQLVRLAKYPDIQITMDILVIDVPDKWGMLLSRKWGATLGGSIQMDWTYATVPASEFSLVKLYSEKEKRHHVENPGSSSSIMTKKVMQQLDLRTTRPYQNVCAMDSRPVKVEGMIEN